MTSSQMKFHAYRIGRRELLVLAIIATLMMLPQLVERPIVVGPDLPALAKMGPGCMADLMTSRLACHYEFADGSWITKVSY